jgi:hypothetical protein
MKFSIRDLLLVTMIVALAVGWWVDRSRTAILRRDRANLLESVLTKEGWKISQAGHYLTVYPPSSPFLSPKPHTYVFDLSAEK